MTNEKDREIAGIIRSECFIDISQTERPCLEWDLDTAANVISEYRSEAVKAERTRDIAGEVWDLLSESIKISGRTALYDKIREKFPIPAVLSNDQEVISWKSTLEESEAEVRSALEQDGSVSKGAYAGPDDQSDCR